MCERCETMDTEDGRRAAMASTVGKKEMLDDAKPSIEALAARLGRIEQEWEMYGGDSLGSLKLTGRKARALAGNMHEEIDPEAANTAVAAPPP